MSIQNNHIQAKFGIDEIYFHIRLNYDLLEKLQRRAVLCFDAEDSIVAKHVSHDMILVFHHRDPNQNLILRFLKALDQDTDKKNFIESNTLLNEEELYLAIKSKTFVLVTHRMLVKETYNPACEPT